MDEKTIMVFSPHPDDETLGMGGTIAKRAKKGNKIIIIIMTDGRHAFSTLGINRNPTPEELKEIRKKEEKRALEKLGVQEENLFFLDFEDGTLEDNESFAEEKILNLFAKNIPSEVYFTHEKDEHIDHRATNRIVRNALKKSGIEPKKYQYSIRLIRSGNGHKIDVLVNLLQRKMFYANISKVLNLKKAAISEFKSQTTIFSNKQEKPIFSTIGLGSFTRGYETFYKDE